MKRKLSLLLAFGSLSFAISTGCGQDVPVMPQPAIAGAMQGYGMMPQVGIGTSSAPSSSYPLDGILYTQYRPVIPTNLTCGGASAPALPIYSQAAFAFLQNRGEFLVQHLTQTNFYYGISFLSVVYNGNHTAGTVTLSQFQPPICKMTTPGSSNYSPCTNNPFQNNVTILPATQITYNYTVAPGMSVTLTSTVPSTVQGQPGGDPYLLCGLNGFAVTSSALLSNIQPENWYNSFFR